MRKKSKSMLAILMAAAMMSSLCCVPAAAADISAAEETTEAFVDDTENQETEMTDSETMETDASEETEAEAGDTEEFFSEEEIPVEDDVEVEAEEQDSDEVVLSAESEEQSVAAGDEEEEFTDAAGVETYEVGVNYGDKSEYISVTSENKDDVLGDLAAVKEHGDDQQHSKESAKHEFLFREHIGIHAHDDQAQRRSHDCDEDRHLIASEKLRAKVEHIIPALCGKGRREKAEALLRETGVVADGRDEHQKDGQQTHERVQAHGRRQDLLSAACLLFFHSQPSSEQRVVRRRLADEPVRRHDHNEAHDRLIERRGGGHAVVRVLHQRVEHEGIEHLRRIIQHRVVLRDLIEQAGLRVHDVAETQQRHYDDGRHQHGDCDAPELLPRGRAVNVGRLIDLLVKAGQRGQVKNRAIADALPELHDQQDHGPVLAVLIEADILQPEHQAEAVDDADIALQKRLYDKGDRDVGNKRRQDHTGLEILCCPFMDHLVDADRDRHIADRTEEGKQEVIPDRIARQPPRRIADHEQIPEILQPVPRTFEDPVGIVEFLERDDKTGHGYIIERNQQQYRRKRHKKKRLVLPCVFNQFQWLFSLSCMSVSHEVCFLLLLL